MTADFRESIVRIIDDQGRTTGTGFVVSDEGLIVTCAHVIQAAGAGPGDTAEIILYATGDKREVRVIPEWWSDPMAEDVAILRLIDSQPDEIKPLLLGASGGTSGNPFKAFGFPKVGKFEGIWGYGSIGDMTAEASHRLLQLTGTREITVGFSGGPVLNTVTRRVVGMVTSITQPDKYERLTETAFITPTETLREICPVLQLSDICPYKGLAAFTEDDAEFFFGRGELVTELVAKLRSSPRFLAVVGPSGSGKSSAVQAGLFPALRRGEIFGSEDWHLLTFRPGTDPFAALNAVGLSIDSELETASQAFLNAHPDVERLILFVDQFEELFALCTEPLQKRFLTSLVELLESDVEATVILTLRGDFYDHLLHHRSFKEYLDIGQVNVVSMGKEELREVIQEPAQAVGLSFESGLVEMILGEVSQLKHPLPLLEAALTQMWKLRNEGILSHDSYQRVGQVTGAISQWAEDAYSGLDERERSLAQRIFTRLIRYGEGEIPDARQRQSLVELLLHPDEEGFLHSLVRQLADARLLVTNRDRYSGQETVEIIHDALIWEWGRLRQWVTQQREFLLWRQRLIERLTDWQAKDEDEGALLRGAQLVEAEQWLSTRTDDLNYIERQFIQESIVLRRMEREAREKLRRRIITGLTIGLAIALLLALLACGLAGLTGIQWQRAEQETDTRATAEADARSAEETAVARANSLATAQSQTEEQRRIAISRQLAAQSTRELEAGHYEVASLLAIEAGRIAETSDAFAAIRANFTHSGRISLILNDHRFQVNQAIWNSSETRILTCSNDGTARIWDSITGQEILSFRSSSSGVRRVAWSGNDSRIATANWDGLVEIWNAETGDLLQSLDGHTAWINYVVWNSNDTRVLTASKDGTARVWDIETGEEILSLPNHQNGAHQAIWNSDEQLILTISGDGLIRVWDAGTGTELQEMSDDSIEANWAIWSSNSNRFLVAVDDGTARVWDTETGEEIMCDAHNDGIRYAVWDSDESHILTASNDGTAQVLDATTCEVRIVLSGHTEPVWRAMWSRDDNRILTASNDGTARIWDASTGSELTVVSGGTNWDWHVDWTDDGKRILIAGCERKVGFGSCAQGSVRVWNTTQGAESLVLVGHEGGVRWADWSRDESRILTVGEDDTARVWDAVTGDELKVLFAQESNIEYIEWNNNGRVATSRDDGLVEIWESETGQRLAAIAGHTDRVLYAQWNADDRRIMTTSQDGTTRVSDTTTGEQLLMLTNPDMHPVEFAAWNRDESCILTDDLSGTKIVWDATTGELLTTLYDGSWTNWIEWNTWGNYILTAGCGSLNSDYVCTSGVVLIWDAETGQERMALVGHTSWVQQATWNSSETLILTASIDGTARIYDAMTGEEVLTFSGHESGVNLAVWGSAEERILSASSDNTARVWDPATGKEIFILDGHDSGIQYATWNEEETQILTASRDGTVRVWYTQMSKLIDVACHHATRNLTHEEWQRFMSYETNYHATCPNLPVPEG